MIFQKSLFFLLILLSWTGISLNSYGNADPEDPENGDLYTQASTRLIGKYHIPSQENAQHWLKNESFHDEEELDDDDGSEAVPYDPDTADYNEDHNEDASPQNPDYNGSSSVAPFSINIQSESDSDASEDLI